jgi:hypothetical protein
MRLLSPAALHAIEALLDAGRLERMPVDARRAEAFLTGCRERLSQLPLLTSASVKYDVAYDASHDIGEALLAAYGYRTRNGPGQHEALGRFLRAVLDDRPGESAARRFDRLRRARNQSHYDAKPVGSADAELATRVAHELLESAIARGIGP